LARLPRGAVRSQFHDSFEYYGASWSPTLPAKFREMHGYDIQRFAGELAGTKPLDADTLGRIKGDYRRTLAALHLEYIERWVSWSHAQGFIARHQAHGSPGRLLDLYGAADVPETESFGATRLPLLHLRQDADNIREDPDPPVNLIGRFASSAAHVNGRGLASSETLTWLRENFHESPAQAKPQLDRLFIAGINHVFYHGTTYSPADAAWPGWFFYAATQLNPTNPLWRDFEAMHDYVARVQSVMQEGRPDNDVLFYWPEADEQDDAEGLVRQHGMHDNEWLKDSKAGRLARLLIEDGHSLDFISDAQLRGLRVDEGRLRTAAGVPYDVLVIPNTRRMPVETLAALVELAKTEARLMFGGLPEDVPGLGRLPERRAELRRLLAQPVFTGRLDRFIGCHPGPIGGRNEPMARDGLWHARRTRGAEGTDYFVANLQGGRGPGWVTLNTGPGHVVIMNPLTGQTGLAAADPASTRPRIYLQLEPGESVILRTYATKPDVAPWPYRRATAYRHAIPEKWQLSFVAGGPELPRSSHASSLGDWARYHDRAAGSFAGTARYRVEFRVPGRADDWRLDLGDVRETARVTLNGRYLGTVWTRPAIIAAGSAMKVGRNVLEIEVTNLPANRVRDLDRRTVDWKIMKDINLASLRYQALDASTWEPQPSGLLGPVVLIPMEAWPHSQIVAMPKPSPYGHDEVVDFRRWPLASCVDMDP
jgi:hypothetical protein